MRNNKKKEEKIQNADEIAKIMVENMKANMKESDFFSNQDKIRREAALKVLKKKTESIRI